MKKTILFILLSFVTINSYGTAQAPDYLIYQGDTMMLFACPLDYYPDQILIKPERLFGGSGCFSTGWWRGYIATWELIDNELFLIEVKNTCYPSKMENTVASYSFGTDAGNTGSKYADLKSLFGEKYKNGKVKADWFSGELIIPKGKLLYEINDAFLSIYEKEPVFRVEKGNLTGFQECDNSKTRKSRYVENQALLIEYLRNAINYDNVPQLDTINRRVSVRIISVDDLGKIDSVEVVKSVNDIYDKEAVRVVKSIPEWEVLYKKGEQMNKRWTIPINFEMKKRNAH